MNNYKNEFIETLPEEDKKYYSKEYSYVLKIDNKYYLPIEKSRLKKDFCFGYGLNGVSTQEDYENASNMANYADTSEKYFMDENLEEINHKIACCKYFLQDFKNWEDEEEYFRNNKNREVYHLQGQKFYLSKGLKTDDYKISYAILDNRYFEIYNNGGQILRQATKEEIQAILEALEEEKKDFTKRLNTYLKKYGTSKVRTWTYLRD